MAWKSPQKLLFYPRYKQDAIFGIPDGVTTAADMAIYNNPIWPRS